jgi:hypothetical protein
MSELRISLIIFKSSPGAGAADFGGKEQLIWAKAPWMETAGSR